MFFYFLMMSQLKHPLLIVFLVGHPPKKALKSVCFSWDIHEKVKKHHAIAPAALGGCGGLGQLWEALAELWEGPSSS